jgi:oxygen-independent coproporphyrinogen-3 oxidase
MFETRYRSHHDSKSFIEKNIQVLAPSKMSSKEEFENMLSNCSEKSTGGIYFHVPYCDKICTFCNMNRKFADDSLSSYSEFLINEIKRYSTFNYVRNAEFDCVYFGGGTPTILSEKNIENILKEINKNFNLTEKVEFTFESTIHNLTTEKIKIMNDYGVNRISLGIQSFNDSGRKVFGRTYDKKTVIEKLKNIQKNFKGTIGIDIIYNYPGQTVVEIKEDAKIIKDLDIDSVSFYSLMIHDGSVLSALIKENKLSYKNKIEKDFHIHTLFLDELLSNGYELLELTKITKNGRDLYKYIKNNYSNHNLLPIGRGAGGRMSNYGVYNVSEKMSVYSKISALKDKLNEFLGYFQYAAFNEDYFESKLSKSAFDVFTEKLNFFIEKGLLRKQGKTYFYTTEGVFWGNNIAVELLDSIIKTEIKGEVI